MGVCVMSVCVMSGCVMSVCDVDSPDWHRLLPSFVSV